MDSKAQKKPLLPLTCVPFLYKLLERLKLDIMDTNKSYMANLCHYFEK